MRRMTRTRLSALLAAVLFAAATAPLSSQQAPPNRRAEFERLAKAALAQHQGTVIARGVREPVEVLRDQHGIPHIYAKNTYDLFFAQGFTVAQDRMWQLEMWRRNGEGKLAEVLGPSYVTRDRFARLLAFRGDWDEEMRKYHPEGPVIFDAFAQGVNAAIQKALDEQKVPVEFGIMGFQPAAALDRQDAAHADAGLDAVAQRGRRSAARARREGARPREDARAEADRSRDAVRRAARTGSRGHHAGDPDAHARRQRHQVGPHAGRTAFGRWRGSGLGARGSGRDAGLGVAADHADYVAGFGSNNWVIGGKKSATGMPIIANDPHREVVNPALRYVVHLNAPGWNAIGATEPGLPGISIGHNDRVAWGFTILGMDQQDLYVEETDPANPKRYRWKGAWEEMKVERELICGQGPCRSPSPWTCRSRGTGRCCTRTRPATAPTR